MIVENTNTKPLCPAFGECGGCSYQDISYSDELCLKENYVRDLLKEYISTDRDCFKPIVASPKPYFYRNRLDLKLKQTLEKKVLIGFTPKTNNGVIEIDDCFLADEQIRKFIPALKFQAKGKITAKHREANLVVRTGDDGRVLWGGVGRRSCRMEEKDYFWTEINGRRIFYSLETFFQANLSILPKLFEHLERLSIWKGDIHFLDLYGGVGLFGIALYHHFKKVTLIENMKPSIWLAQYNIRFNELKNFEIIEGNVEDQLPKIIDDDSMGKIAMIDPPRAGLSEEAASFLSDLKGVDYFLYLSCNPESLARDLKTFCAKKWEIKEIVSFDFFPKTKHIETLVLLERS